MKNALALFALPLIAQSWNEYLGGPDSSHYSPLKQVNTRNVNKLGVAWNYETGDELSYTFCPLVVDNVALENIWERGKALPAKGPIELQQHPKQDGTFGEIKFKNVYIKELPE